MPGVVQKCPMVSEVPGDGRAVLEVPGGVEAEQSVLDADLVERGALLVAEECVRDPDPRPAVVAEPQLRRPADARRLDTTA